MTIAVVLHLGHSLHLLEVVRCKAVSTASCEYLGAVVLSCSKSRKPKEEGNEPVLVDDLTSIGQLANQYRYI